MSMKPLPSAGGYEVKVVLREVEVDVRLLFITCQSSLIPHYWDSQFPLIQNAIYLPQLLLRHSALLRELPKPHPFDRSKIRAVRGNDFDLWLTHGRRLAVPLLVLQSSTRFESGDLGRMDQLDSSGLDKLPKALDKAITMQEWKDDVQ